jgi:RNA polymerase sigma-70 factor, ECF subfamily
MILIVLPDVADDRQLLRHAQKQDKDALRIIYERYFPVIYQFIRLRVNSREQARDIAADVFLDFMVALRGRNSPHTNLRGWLFRVARNKVYEHYGKEKQIPKTVLEDWIPNQHDDSPESQLLDVMRIEQVRNALTELKDEQQEVIILRFGQALDLQETADIMNKSVSAIKSLQFRAIQNLRDLIHVGEEG